MVVFYVGFSVEEKAAPLTSDPAVQSFSKLVFPSIDTALGSGSGEIRLAKDQKRISDNNSLGWEKMDGARH